VAASAVILMQLVTMSVYNSLGPSLFALFASVAMLWRAADDESEAPSRTDPLRHARSGTRRKTLSSYSRLLRRQAGIVAALGLLGGLAGGLYQANRGSPYVASQSILLPSPLAPEGFHPPLTIDTDAQLAAAGPVLAAIAKVEPAGLTTTQVADRLKISATPNTRILHLAFAAPSPQEAIRGVEAASASYLNLRDRLAGGEATGKSPGRVIEAAMLQRSLDGWLISVTTGVMLGVCLGLVFWRLAGEGRTRLSRASTAISLTGLPILAVLQPGGDDAGLEAQLVRTRLSLARRAVSTVLAVPESASARNVAGRLDLDMSPQLRTRGCEAVIVISTRTRMREFARLHESMSLSRQHVIGSVLVEDR